jgi:DNA-binding PadR family transcriptional regulator
MHSQRDLVALTVLAFLGERPCHPYEIQRLIRERHKDFAMGKTRALYHAVERLERWGLIEQAQTSREGKRPERTVYRITEAGRDEYASWLYDLVANPVQEHPAFSAAMSFLASLPVSTAIQALQGRTVALEAGIAGLRTAMQALRERLKLPRVVVLEHELTVALLEAELSWVRSVVEELRDRSLTWDEKELARLFEAHQQSEEMRT